MPTDAGRRLADQALHLLTAYDEAIGDATGAAKELRGLVRCTAPLVFGREHVAPLVAEFLDEFPAISVDLHLADRVLDLHEESFDLALRIGRVSDTSLIQRSLGHVRRVTVASPGYLEAKGCPQVPDDLGSHDIVQHTGHGTSTPWLMTDANGKSLLVNLTARFAVNQADAAIGAARRGRGIVNALSYQVDPDVRAGHLIRILTQFEPERLPVALVWSASRHPIRRVRALIDFLAAGLRSLPVLG